MTKYVRNIAFRSNHCFVFGTDGVCSKYQLDIQPNMNRAAECTNSGQNNAYITAIQHPYKYHASLQTKADGGS